MSEAQDSRIIDTETKWARPEPALYRVCWMSIVEDRRGQSQPMPRHMAEFLAEDEGHTNVLRRYWIETCEPSAETEAEKHERKVRH